MQAPDFLLLPALISGELWRRFARRVRSGPLYRWRYSGAIPGGLAVTPQDLRPADPQRAIEFYSGHYSFGQESVSTGGDSPFAATAPSDEWFSRLHDFRWLRHHRAANTELARANANALLTDWIEMWGNQLNAIAWQSDIVASRLIAWFCHVPSLTEDSGPANYRTILRSMAKQTRYLHLNAPQMRDGYPRLLAIIALAYASVCLAGREKTIKSASRELDRELGRQILPDGGHISRNPVVLVHILADLLPLKQAYGERGQPASAILVSAIDRIMAAIKFFQHSNGELAQFNGTGLTPTELTAMVLGHNNSTASPQRSIPQTGFERLAAGKTVVIMDTGKPTSRLVSRRTLAGTLSFELSCGTTRFIANCGTPDNSFKLYAPFVRATAAHSTATINDYSSSRFANDTALSNLLPSSHIRSPETVSASRMDGNDHVGVEASHDGYQQKFSIIHKRELVLAKQGAVLNGCDSFLPAGGQPLESAVAALRFHLPATINASMLTSGHSILIAAPNSDAWIYTCLDADIVLEESIQFSGPGQPRKSQQIVVYLHPARQTSIRWSLELRARRSSAQSRKSKKRQSTPPDLLDTLTQEDSQAE